MRGENKHEPNDKTSLQVDYLPGLSHSSAFSLLLYGVGIMELRMGCPPSNNSADHRQTYSKTISSVGLAMLHNEIYRQDFFSLNDRYTEYMITDLSTTRISVNQDGKKKRVTVYDGHLGNIEEVARYRKIHDVIRKVTALDDWVREVSQTSK